MRRAVVCVFCIAFTIFIISACAGPTRVEKNYGKSVKQALLNQILDPEAGKNLEPVTGMDGRASQTTIEKYRRTFEPSREVPEFLIQTGTQVGKPKEGSGYSK